MHCTKVVTVATEAAAHTKLMTVANETTDVPFHILHPLSYLISINCEIFRDLFHSRRYLDNKTIFNSGNVGIIRRTHIEWICQRNYPVSGVVECVEKMDGVKLRAVWSFPMVDILTFALLIPIIAYAPHRRFLNISATIITNILKLNS